MELTGSCRCHAVRFTVRSRAPYPFLRCYCSVCRKTAGGGGYAVNLHADAASLVSTGRHYLSVYHVMARETESGGEGYSPPERIFCQSCGSALWVFDPRWPDLIHPFASAIDSPLPEPPEILHMMLDYKAPWVQVPSGPGHKHFARYPDETLQEWHERHGLWEVDP